MVSEGKFVEGDQAVNTGDCGIMGGRQIDNQPFFAGKFSCGYADGADAEDFEGGFVERADHEACFDFFRYEIIYGVGLGVGGLEIVTGVVLGKRAFDAGVETLTEAEQKVFAELSIRVVGEFGGQARNVHRSR